MKDISLSSFSKRLCAAIETSGLNAAAVSHLLGATPGSVSSWKHGGAYPSAPFLIKLSEVLSVSIDWLLTGESP